MFCTHPQWKICSSAISVTVCELVAGGKSWYPLSTLSNETVSLNLRYSTVRVCLLEARCCRCEWDSGNTRAAVHSSSVQHDTVSHLTAISVKGWHTLSGGSWVEPIDEMKQVDFSLGLKWNEKQMSWRVTESVCVLSARPMWVMALICPPAPRLFIILRWQGGAGKRRGLGAPSWSITPEVSFPLLSDRYMDNCSSCLQTPAHLNE